MNENAEAWVEAVESGEYEQGRQVLRSGADKYCCLGVACELAVEAGVIEREFDEAMGYYRYGAERVGALLPAAVQDWLGLDSYDGLFKSGRSVDSLVGLNDRQETFAEIAQVIRKEPKGLFS